MIRELGKGKFRGKSVGRRTKKTAEPIEETDDTKNLVVLRLDNGVEELINYIVENGEKKFRAKQCYEWMHKKLAVSFDDMTNLPKAMRDACKERFEYVSLETVQVQEMETQVTVPDRVVVREAVAEVVLVQVQERNLEHLGLLCKYQ